MVGNNNSSFERGAQSTEQAIQTTAFGGLNTTAAKMSVPLTDSPDLLNVDINDSGVVEKRKGTELAYTRLEALDSAFLVNMTTALGYNLAVGKFNLELRVFEVIDRVITLLMQKANVFTAAAQFVRPSAVRTVEAEPRLIFTSGVNTPIQLTFTEVSIANVPGANTSTGAVDPRFPSAITANCIVFQNRVRVPGATVSYGGGTLGIAGLPATGGTKTVDVVMITWQWWAEALGWFGDRFWKSTTRFNATATDRIVAIPPSIASDMTPVGTAVQYPIRILNRALTGTPYSRLQNPAAATEFGFSDGSLLTDPVNDKLNPSPFFVCMGALSGSTPFPIYFSRLRETRFNNGTGIAVNNLDVFTSDAGTLAPKVFTGWGGTPAYGDAVCYEGIGIISSSSTANVAYVGFDGANAGVPQNTFVTMVNKEPRHVGSAATTIGTVRTDGSYVPIYGIGLYADYKNGNYPSDCEIFQERLVLSAFAHLPATVLISSTSDAIVPSKFFNFFQVTDNLSGLDSDPFDFTITSQPQDYIVKVVNWQTHLFVFTRFNTYRVGGTNYFSPITPTVRNVSLIGTTGLINRSAYAVTDNNLLYLSDVGVSALVSQNDTTEYSVIESSLKIRKDLAFNYDRVYDISPWMVYNPTTRKVYLGIPVFGIPLTTRRIYVFNLFRASWTVYDAPSGFNAFHGAVVYDRSLGYTLAAVCRVSPGAHGIVVFDAPLYLDFVNRQTASMVRSPRVTHTTADAQQRYSLNPTASNLFTFPVIPISTVKDLWVTLDGVLLQQGVDYQKVEYNGIYLSLNPGAGKSLVIQPRLPVNYSDGGKELYNVLDSTAHIPVNMTVVDNVFYRDWTKFTLDDSATLTVIIDSSGLPGSQKRVYGLAYPSYYESPSYSLDFMTKIKRLTHLYMSFDNSVANKYFTSADLNGAQDPRTIVDTPIYRCNASLGYRRNDELTAEVNYDIYSYPVMMFDNIEFDNFAPIEQRKQNTLMKLPLEGTCYSFNFVTFSWDETTFRLNAYQIAAQLQNAGNVFKE